MVLTTEEADVRFLLDVYNIVNFHWKNDPPRWFVSFGSLLWYIRDRNQNKKLEGDLDISLFSTVDAKHFTQMAEEFRFKPLGMVVNDVTNRPLQMSFKHVDTKRTLDLYFWYKGRKYYWHTYDYYGEKKKIPGKYVFKGTPISMMEGDLYQYLIYDRIAPFNFPQKYGTLLDTWYPGWYVPDAKFGQSIAVKQVTLKSCRELEKLDV